MPSEVLTQYKSLLLVIRSWEVILGLTVYENLSLYKNYYWSQLLFISYNFYLQLGHIV